MYQPPEDLVFEEIITTIFPEHKGFHFPRCNIEPLPSGNGLEKEVSTTVTTLLPGRKEIEVLIRLIRKKEHASKKGVWVKGEVSSKDGKYKYNVIFNNDTPTVIPI